jgi:hypothetical protein
MSEREYTDEDGWKEYCKATRSAVVGDLQGEASIAGRAILRLRDENKTLSLSLATEREVLASVEQTLRNLRDMAQGGDMMLPVSGNAIVVRDALTELRAKVERMEREKNDAYAQRNKLAVLLAAKYGGSLVDANPQEPGWSCVLLIPTGSGQLSFHVHDSELPYVVSMPAIKIGGGVWDGHDDAEKWLRVERESSRAVSYNAVERK